MSRRILAVVLTFALACGLGACDGTSTTPSPTRPGQPPPPETPPIPQPMGMEVAGSVSDGAWRRLANARVEVVEGPQAGLSTTTDGAGGFRLSGAFDATSRFRATKEGYVAATWPLPTPCLPCNPDWWIHFNLETEGPKADLSGNYRLTFVADPGCRDLPPELQTRTYDASIEPRVLPDGPANTRFLVTLSGAMFHGRYDGFDIGVAGDYASGFIGDLHGTPGVLEQISPTTYLGFEGVPAASINTSDVSRVVASFDGAIDYCERKSGMGPEFSCAAAEALAHVRCVSPKHQMILERR